MGLPVTLSEDGNLVRKAQERAADRLAWFGQIRAPEIAAAVEALEDPAVYGVVVTGDPAFGKSEVASALLERVGSTMHTVRLRSTAVGTGTPYGALAVLVARLGEDARRGSPMSGILRLLAEDAAGRPAVLALETSQNLDELSTATLVNIMVTGTAKLVVVADTATDLPADFHWMLSQGRLREVPLRPLSPDDSLAMFKHLLGGLLPQTVGLQLSAMARGNPRVALLTVAELLQREALTPADGVWLLAPDAAASGNHQLDDLVRARFRRYSPAAQEIIEALACGRHIPLARLVSAFEHADVAQLERDGLVTIDEDGRRLVALSDPSMAEVVRGWLSVPHQRELRARLMADADPDLAVLTDLELLGVAAWTRDCHDQLPPDVAVEAAAASLGLHDPHFALDCLASVERDPRTWPRVQLLRARAQLMLRLTHEAVASLSQITEAQLSLQDMRTVADVAATSAQALRWLPDGVERARTLLEETRARLLVRAGTDAVPEREIRIAVEHLDLADFEHWAFVGDFRRIFERLEATVAQSHPADPEVRLRCAILLMEARTMLGREQEGLALLHEVAAELNQKHGSARVRQEFGARAFVVLLVNGHWRQALALLRGTPGWSVERLQTEGASAELTAGLAYVYAGRGREALNPLLAAIALLERTTSANPLGPAYAAAAFASAQVGDAASARRWLAKLERWSGTCSYQMGSVIGFCSEMARRWIGDPRAAARLIAAARKDIAMGRWNQAGIKLVGATVDGRAEDLWLLEEVCEHRQGPLAETAALLARGTRTGNLDDLGAAADLAAGLELDALESRCAAVALDRARQRGDLAKARLMQARLDALAGRVPVLPVAPSQAPAILTEREREVAGLAALGASNRRIAEDLGLSVRTVEGHLYQVFAKLAVSNRSELAGLL